jgi:dihydropteridine reductase
MNVLILGANGALGNAVSKRFIDGRWRTLLADVTQDRLKAAPFVQLSSDWGAKQQYESLHNAVKAEFGNDSKLDAIVNVGGGFRMDNARSEDIFENSTAMYSSSVETSVIASHLAANFLKEGGLLVLPGAASANGPTPWALTYGAMKSAVHHLVKSLSADGGLPSRVAVVGIAPVMLDTPTNQQSMPQADFSNWTPCSSIADQLFAWAEGSSKADNGAIYRIETLKGTTRYTPF